VTEEEALEQGHLFRKFQLMKKQYQTCRDSLFYFSFKSILHENEMEELFTFLLFYNIRID